MVRGVSWALCGTGAKYMSPARIDAKQKSRVKEVRIKPLAFMEIPQWGDVNRPGPRIGTFLPGL